MSTLDHDIGRFLTGIHPTSAPYYTWTVGVLVLVLYTCINLFRYSGDENSRSFWNAHQWAGPQNRLFPRTRAGIDSIRHSCEIVGKGYYKVCCRLRSAEMCSIRPDIASQFSKNNIPFVLPKFGNNPVVILPPSQVRELIRKPDDEVDLHIIHWEQLANTYTSRPEVWLNAVHLSVVRRQLTRKLPSFSDDLYREMAASFASNWGAEGTSSNQVPVYRSCIKIVSRAANRVLYGVELCECTANCPPNVPNLTS